jgi:hypothetical protein
MKITLTKAITAHGDETNEIELREPTGEDVMALGYPYLIILGDGEDQAIELRPKVIGKYVSRLAGIPPSSLNKVSPTDFAMLTGVVMGFFGVEAETLKS